jgi:membrane protein YdbS with pleckstrin-like domain
MTAGVERSAEWVYQGVWLVLADCFRVPQQPPSLPVGGTGFCRSFHPSRRYLDYLKLYFWVLLVLIDGAIFVGWIAVYLWSPWVGWLLAVPALAVAILPDIVAYVAIHLRYDTMWYVLTERSLRVRRGIWVILEHTITFENVQNVSIRQGPIEQLFGISSLVVETAGSSDEHAENPFAVGNKAILEGIDNPQEIRQLIMEQVRKSRTAGLGDEVVAATENAWPPDHLKLLKEIRDEVRGLM